MKTRVPALKAAAAALAAVLALAPFTEAAQVVQVRVRPGPFRAGVPGAPLLTGPAGLGLPGAPALQNTFLSPALPALSLPDAAPAAAAAAPEAVQVSPRARTARRVAALTGSISPVLKASVSGGASAAESSAGIGKAFSHLLETELSGGGPAGISVPGTPGIRPSRLSPSRKAGTTEYQDDSPAMQFTPGSIFDWKPVEESPNHGFAPLDWLVRRFLGHKDERFTKGFRFTNVGSREKARVYIYGEKHTDKDVIADNYARLVKDIRPGQPARVLMEAYLGPTLFGSEAVRFLAKKGLDAGKMREAGVRPEQFIVDGWDEAFAYHEATSPELRYSMALYGINRMLFSETRGLAYYRQLYRSAKEAYSLWKVMRQKAISERNIVLDRSLKRAVRNMAKSGGTVHLIAGTEHLIQSPLTADLPLIGRTRLREGIKETLGDTPYWASRPDDREVRAR